MVARSSLALKEKMTGGVKGGAVSGRWIFVSNHNRVNQCVEYQDFFLSRRGFALVKRHDGSDLVVMSIEGEED